MKKSFFDGRWLAVLLAAGLLAGCGAAPAASGAPSSSSAAKEPVGSSSVAGVYQQLTPEQAKARIDSEDAIILLDVRTAEEYAAGHIPGAQLLPNEEIGDSAPPELPDKNAEILIYCRSGNRSAKAAEKLAALGYTAVWDFGGINAWPYETETGEYVG